MTTVSLLQTISGGGWHIYVVFLCQCVTHGWWILVSGLFFSVTNKKEYYGRVMSVANCMSILATLTPQIFTMITVHSLDGNYGINYGIISCLTGLSIILGIFLAFQHRGVFYQVVTQ